MSEKSASTIKIKSAIVPNELDELSDSLIRQVAARNIDWLKKTLVTSPDPQYESVVNTRDKYVSFSSLGSLDFSSWQNYPIFLPI
jgi:hypothetical protein